MTPKEITHLANELATHDGVTHWTISTRIFGRGDVFSRLTEGKGCEYRTLLRASRWFAENWPDDLPWPDAIDRPARQIDEVA